MPWHKPFLGATLLTAGRGGIARVARLTAKALIEGGENVQMLSLLDERVVEISGQRAQTARGNRMIYGAHCYAAALSCSHFIYDSVGTARAHPRLPFLQRPSVVWIHGIEVWHALHSAREKAIRNADLVLVNSQYTLDRFQSLHWPLENAHVCWLATEEDEPPAVRPSFEGPPTVLLMARVDKGNFYKGHKELIESWSYVKEAVPEARLVIAGGGSGLGHLKELVRHSPAGRSIEVRGFVPEEELPDLWQQAHVFAMPSRGEGFGLVYIEAMRHGLPVIASVHDAGREVNVDGKTGYNVDLDKPDELIDKLIHLLRSPALVQTMGQAGHNRWRQHFCFQEFKKRFRQIVGLHL